MEGKISTECKTEHNTSYMRGSIVRIKLHDFMTYTDCEFRPGPRLNLVIGPNGSGKSSIVCAIALGLNGSPKDLGRSSEIGRFVRHGQAQGFVEIELHEDSAENPVIRREIIAENTKTGKSNWFLNGRKSKKEKIESILHEYNIQVGNLCQILPQDRVGDFSKFDQYRLFEETIMSTLGDSLLQKRTKLIEMQDEMIELERELSKSENRLEREKLENSRLQKEVKRLKERENILKEVKNLKQLVPWLEFEQSRLEARQISDEYKKKKNELEKKKQTLAPLKNRVQQCKDRVAVVNKTYKNERREQKTFLDKLNRRFEVVKSSVDSYRDDLREYRRVKDDQKFAHERIKEVETRLRSTELALEKLPTADFLDKELSKCRDELDPIHDEKVALETDLKKIKMSVERLNREKSAMERLLHKFDGLKERNIKMLQRVANSHRIIRSYNLITRMREQNSFVGKVHGPVLLELQFNSDEHATIVEQLMPQALLTMYITENESDRDRLMKSEGVNVLNVDPESIKTPKRIFALGILKASISTDLPTEKDDINSYGVTGFADQLIRANPIVLEAIRRYASLDKVLVGDKRADIAVDKHNLLMKLDRRLKGGAVKMITQKMVYNSHRSKYGNRELVFSQIQYDSSKGKGVGGAKLLSKDGNALDENEAMEKQDLETKLKSINVEIDEIFLGREEKHKKLEKVKRRHEELDRKRQEIENTRRTRKSVESRKKSNILALRKAKVDAQQDFEKTLLNIKTQILKKMKSTTLEIDSCVGGNGDALDYSFQVTTCATDLARLHGRHLQLVDEWKRASSNTQELQNEVETFSRKMKAALSEVKQKKDEAQRKAPIEKYMQLFKQLKELYSTIDELNNAISLKEDEAGRIMQNDSLLLDFENRQKAIEALQPKVESLREQVRENTDRLEELRASFEPTVKSTIDQVSDKFRGMFDEIAKAGYACAGEVSFNKVPGDFRKYGVGLRVKFRNDQAMQQLSADIHSGGERSLSTFLYLLALQDLAQSPFRVVDEINQGMDTHKERLAFHRLIDSSCRRKLPQYFLITPKLLRGLDYNEGVTICFVFNGPKSISQMNWNMTDFINRGNAIKGKNHNVKRRRISTSASL